jgi:hypothetical protein
LDILYISGNIDLIFDLFELAHLYHFGTFKLCHFFPLTTKGCAGAVPGIGKGWRGRKENNLCNVSNNVPFQEERLAGEGSGKDSPGMTQKKNILYRHIRSSCHLSGQGSTRLTGAYIPGCSGMMICLAGRFWRSKNPSRPDCRSSAAEPGQ